MNCFFSSSPNVLLFSSILLLAFFSDAKSAVAKAEHQQKQHQQSATKKAAQLSRALLSIFEDGTKVDEIEKAYSNVADAEIFDPKKELEMVKAEMEQYLKARTAVAWNAKLSLEQRHLISASKDALENGTFTMESLNNPNSPNFVRYLNAKRMSNTAMLYQDDNFDADVEASAEVRLRPNPNFRGLATNSDASAVHVPTPIYNRDAKLLEQIQWSDIDQQFRRNREQLKDLNFQKFCSESGFLRYFPYAPWLWEDRSSELDLFDCRNVEWYVNAATAPRNLIILLDTSGSMLGQRFEIARQTIESILGTLSDNDFFNIIHFSKQANLLEECNGRELVQGTLRNKKLLLSRLFNISSEGKADYELALHKAFVALMNLPEESVHLRSKEETAREAARREAAAASDRSETETAAEGTRPIVLEDNVLTASERFFEAIKKFTESDQRMGCQDMIMLITDGAPGFYREIFDLYNREKRVRFFSFVVGEEAKDFEQVRWMACANRGFMAHISSMADVQEKVQQYVRILSRTVSRQQKVAFTEDSPLWSGATRERMSDDFVVSVSFPVVLPDGQFMGVSSVTVPLVELSQLAHPSRIGARSYFALLDGSGYALTHPQLRPMEETGELKAGFNSVNWHDMEAQQAHPSPSAEKVLHPINCASGTIEPQRQGTLFAVEKMRHVYQQENHYQVACIDGTPYSLLLAMPSDDTKRLKRVRSSEEVRLNWLKGADWRLHPKWRYCHLNDSDAAVGPERAFREYAKQMQAGGKMPEFCRNRRALVERALLDLQASEKFSELWRQELGRNKKSGIHLAFFVAPSGVVRFHNQSLVDKHIHEERPQPSATEGGTNRVYKHFLLELNPNSAEADFFRRSVRQPPDQITFDINRQTRLWQGHGHKTAYGQAENESLLALAYKTVRVDGAVAGVAGIEFLYDTLVAQMGHIDCMSSTDQVAADRIRCYLLDEHGYVLFSSSNSTRYSDFVHHNILLPQIALEQAQNMTLSGRKRKGQKAFIANRAAQQPQGAADEANNPQLELGRFFGQLNRVTEWTMELLLKKGLYKRLYFTDAQAVCDSSSANDPDWVPSQTWAPTGTASSAHPITLFLQLSLSSILHLFLQFGAILSSMFLPNGLVHGLQLHTFASLLKVNDGRFPCRMHSTFYLAQPEVSIGGTDGALLEGDAYERPCRQNAAQCAVRVFASWVPRTNLLLVIIHQGGRSNCFHSDPAHCPLSQPSEIQFGFSSSLPPLVDDAGNEQSSPPISIGQSTARQCAASQPQQRQKPKQCLKDEFIENEQTDENCVGSAATPQQQRKAMFSIYWMAFLSSFLAFFHPHIPCSFSDRFFFFS